MGDSPEENLIEVVGGAAFVVLEGAGKGGIGRSLGGIEHEAAAIVAVDIPLVAVDGEACGLAGDCEVLKGDLKVGAIGRITGEEVCQWHRIDKDRIDVEVRAGALIGRDLQSHDIAPGSAKVIVEGAGVSRLREVGAEAAAVVVKVPLPEADGIAVDAGAEAAGIGDIGSGAFAGGIGLPCGLGHGIDDDRVFVYGDAGGDAVAGGEHGPVDAGVAVCPDDRVDLGIGEGTGRGQGLHESIALVIKLPLVLCDACDFAGRNIPEDYGAGDAVFAEDTGDGRPGSVLQLNGSDAIGRHVYGIGKDRLAGAKGIVIGHPQADELIARGEISIGGIVGSAGASQRSSREVFVKLPGIGKSCSGHTGRLIVKVYLVADTEGILHIASGIVEAGDVAGLCRVYDLDDRKLKDRSAVPVAEVAVYRAERVV